jgi:hypothetical protein
LRLPGWASERCGPTIGASTPIGGGLNFLKRSWELKEKC